MIDVKLMNKLNKEYRDIVDEFKSINDNFSYDINEDHEYRVYTSKYSDSFDLKDYVTEKTIFKSKDKNEFIKILKKLDGNENIIYSNEDDEDDEIRDEDGQDCDVSVKCYDRQNNV